MARPQGTTNGDCRITADKPCLPDGRGRSPAILVVTIAIVASALVVAVLTG